MALSQGSCFGCSNIVNSSLSMLGNSGSTRATVLPLLLNS